MAQLTELTEYDETRLDFKPQTLTRLRMLYEDLEPLLDDFEILPGDICCGSCAAQQCGSEGEQSGKPYYVYWSIQDEEHLDEVGYHMYLGFGATDGTTTSARRAGQVITKHLQNQGRTIEWDQNPHTRILAEV